GGGGRVVGGGGGGGRVGAGRHQVGDRRDRFGGVLALRGGPGSGGQRGDRGEPAGERAVLLAGQVLGQVVLGDQHLGGQLEHPGRGAVPVGRAPVGHHHPGAVLALPGVPAHRGRV